jgi:hypothetical protein
VEKTAEWVHRAEGNVISPRTFLRITQWERIGQWQESVVTDTGFKNLALVYAFTMATGFFEVLTKISHPIYLVQTC